MRSKADKYPAKLCTSITFKMTPECAKTAIIIITFRKRLKNVLFDRAYN